MINKWLVIFFCALCWAGLALFLVSCATLQQASTTLTKAACEHRAEVQATIDAAQQVINSCPM